MWLALEYACKNGKTPPLASLTATKNFRDSQMLFLQTPYSSFIKSTLLVMRSAIFGP